MWTAAGRQRFVVLLWLAFGCAWCRCDEQVPPPSLPPTDLTAAAMRAMVRTYDECQRGEDTFATCLKRRAIVLIERVARSSSVALTDDVRLERTGTAPLVDANWEHTLPRSADARDAAVTEVLLQRVAGFLDGRTVSVRLPSLNALDVGRALEEGRNRTRRMMSMMMMGVMMKMATMVPIAIAGLYILAGKALMVSKIALLLASIIGINKLMSMKGSSSSSGHSSGGGGWSSGGGGGGGGGWDRRSQEAAQTMAYKAYATDVMN